MARVKIALCQFGLRDARSHGEIETHLKEEAEKALASSPDFIVFPEYVTFSLLAMGGPEQLDQDRHKVLRNHIIPFTSRYKTLFSDLSRRSGAIMIGGSHWTFDDRQGKGYNSSYLFYPDGRVIEQRKNHLYPNEALFGTAPGDSLSVFETPKANIGIMTCYDAEFPEVARHLMLQGAQILFCPTTTNTERGFYRIRHCCSARAVENQVIVAQCHSAGRLSVPKDKPFTAFGRSAPLCPIDDQTGVNNGIMMEAKDGQKEEVMVGEIDLEVLARSRQASEATILKDRRPDLYKSYYRLY